METQPCVQYIHPFYVFKIMTHCFLDNEKLEQDLKAVKSKKELSLQTPGIKSYFAGDKMEM